MREVKNTLPIEDRPFMPQKGFVTQTFVILLHRPVTLELVEARLAGFKVVDRRVNEETPLGGPRLMLSYRPELNGHVSIDQFSRQWPDEMGDPKTDAVLFGAWHMGLYGPGAWPGGLRRAREHSWQWPGGRTEPLKHNAFLRIAISYVFGADKNAPVVPQGVDARHELEFLTTVVEALMPMSEALCFFNPNGECVRSHDQLASSLEHHRKHQLPPLNIWTNVRLFRIDEISPGWLLMDCVGMPQLDLPDHEVCFSSDKYDPGEVDYFIRNASHYMISNGEIVSNGDSMDGPGEARWQVWKFEKPRSQPPRPVLRWLAIDGTEAPPELKSMPN